MAITYPRIYPFSVASIAPPLVFTPSRVQNVARTRGGAVQTAERGRSLWSIDAKTTILAPAQFEEMQAWFDSLRGGLNTFIFYDPGRARPRAYPGVGWAGVTRHSGLPFTGSCTLQSASGYTVQLSDLPTSYVLSAGDMLCWLWGSTRTLHRAVETVTAVNGALTVQVEPDVPPGSPTLAQVALETAHAVFRLVDPFPAPPRVTYGGDQISFKAIQALY